VPTIRRFGSCKISIYADDICHHISISKDAAFRAIVEIETMAVRAGEIRRATEAMSWARENVSLLHTEWGRLNRKTGRA
jgi:hypothetical protein